MNTEIEEGNKLIAAFMGYKYFKSPYGGCGLCKDEKDMSTWLAVSNAIYNSSWDWLMPVVEKIESNPKCFLNISGNECNVIIHSEYEGYEPLFEWCENNSRKIDAVWITVLEFIKWHNQKEKHNITFPDEMVNK